MKDIEEIELEGKHFALGFMSGLSKWLFPVALVFVIVALLYAFTNIWIDDTDLDWKHRSGMSLHTDYKTGVQYLSDGQGGMVVRIDEDGKPIKGGKK